MMNANMPLLLLIGLILLVTNLVSFILMAVDKSRAKCGAWRVPEKTLFLATACFGGLGGTLGMFLCRHKTKHWYFRVGFPALLVVQAVILALIVGALL